MKISKYHHSCMLLEKEGTRLLFDPGMYSFVDGTVKAEEFTNISAIFITHNHADHCAISELKTIVATNPGVIILSNPSTHALLEKEGITSEVFYEGVREIGAFSIRAIPAVHEKVPFPLPDNTAYFVDEAFLHPGDSFDTALHGLKPKLLALPTWAPWMTFIMLFDFVKGVSPEMVIPIHDWPLKEYSQEKNAAMFATMWKEWGVAVRPAALRETMEI